MDKIPQETTTGNEYPYTRISRYVALLHALKNTRYNPTQSEVDGDLEQLQGGGLSISEAQDHRDMVRTHLYHAVHAMLAVDLKVHKQVDGGALMNVLMDYTQNASLNYTLTTDEFIDDLGDFLLWARTDHRNGVMAASYEAWWANYDAKGKIVRLTDRPCRWHDWVFSGEFEVEEPNHTAGETGKDAMLNMKAKCRICNASGYLGDTMNEWFDILRVAYGGDDADESFTERFINNNTLHMDD